MKQLKKVTLILTLASAELATTQQKKSKINLLECQSKGRKKSCGKAEFDKWGSRIHN